MGFDGSLRPISPVPTRPWHVKVGPKLTNFPKNSILRHLEAFFGHSEENKKVLELNFTLQSILTNFKAPQSRGKSSIFKKFNVKHQGKYTIIYNLQSFTGCCKTSVKLCKPFCNTFLGVILLFLCSVDCQIWAIFHFSTLWL